MKVQILSRKFIKPATPTPPHLRSLKVSSIDQLQPPIHAAFILYYLANGDENGDHRSKRLEKSLSEILTLYYPVAGRYIRDKQMIDCNDEGVEFLEAQVSGQLAQLIQGEKLEELNHLLPRPIQSTSTPVALVQVNMFECGGLAMVLLISHNIADGIAATSFLNAWAKACRAEGINGVVHPKFDLASYFPPRESVPAMQPMKFGVPIITRRFVFNGEAISSLKEIAKGGDSDSESLTKHQPSRVVVVTAFLWKVLIAVSKARRGNLRPSILFHSLNLRGRTALPISDDSFGNLYMVANARFGGHSDSKVELHELVGSLQSSVRDLLDDCMKPQNGDDLVSMVTNSMRNVQEELQSGDIDIYKFTSWCRFPLFEVDFGWGKPIWVSNQPKVVEMVSLTDTKDGDGIEAWVGLDEKNMSLFQNHPEVKAFTSKF